MSKTEELRESFARAMFNLDFQGRLKWEQTTDAVKDGYRELIKPYLQTCKKAGLIFSNGEEIGV